MIFVFFLIEKYFSKKKHFMHKNNLLPILIYYIGIFQK